MIYLGILLFALLVGIVLKAVQASMPWPLRFLLLILALYLVQTCANRWIYGPPQPAPTRAELQQVFDDYPDGGAWTGSSTDSYQYFDYGTYVQLVLGMEIPQLPSVGEDRSVTGGVLWEHRMKLALPERILETVENNRVYLDENYPPPLPFALPGYLSMDDILDLMASWEVPTGQRAAFAALLLDLIDMRLEHPEWPGFRDTLLDLDYAVAMLDRIGHPLEDAGRIALIRQLLADCYTEGQFDGSGFANPGKKWVDGSATMHAIELMHRYGVTEKADLEEIRVTLQRRWSGMEDLEFFSLEEGIALLRLDELEAAIAASE